MLQKLSVRLSRIELRPHPRGVLCASYLLSSLALRYFASSRCADARCPTLPRGLLPQGGLLKEKWALQSPNCSAAGRRSASERRAWLVHVCKAPFRRPRYSSRDERWRSAPRVRISNLPHQFPLYMVTRSGATLNFLAQRSTRFSGDYALQAASGSVRDKAPVRRAVADKQPKFRWNNCAIDVS